MKKIMFGMLILLLLVGTVSAFEFDNVLKYKEKDMVVTIDNAFGLGAEIGNATLASHKTVNEFRNVIRGENRRVMYYDFDFKDIYENGLGEVIFTDVDTGKRINKDYHFERAIYKTKLTPIERKNCYAKILKNNSIENVCTKEIIGYSESQVIDRWERLENNDIRKGIQRIALVTDVLPGDKIDGVWTIAGKKIKKHSVWVSSLNAGLMVYYTFDDVVSDADLAQDSVGHYDANASVVGATNGTAGIINESYTYDGNDDFLNFSNAVALRVAENATFQCWINADSGRTTADSAIMTRGIASPRDFVFWLGAGDSNPGNKIEFWHAGNGDTLTTDPGDIGNETWYHAVAVVNSTGTTLYVNGTIVDTTTHSINLGTTTDDNAFGVRDLGSGGGKDNFWQGEIDECGYWNRTLTSSEVTDLYNGGVGIQYIKNPPATIPTVTLISPADNLITSNPSPIFNISAVASPGNNLINISLFINSTIIYLRNATNAVTGSTNDTLFNLTLPDGVYLWSGDACDDGVGVDCGVTVNRTLTIDTLLPNVTLIGPTGDQGTFSSGINLTLNWTVVEINQDTCWIDYESINTTVACGLNETNLTVSDSSLTTVRFYANDSALNEAFDTISWSYSFIENSATFNANVSETSSQFFEVNLSTTSTVLSISSFMNYDSERFTSVSSCSSGECIVNNTIDTLLVSTGESELKNLFWEVSIFNGTDSINVNTSTRQQNVSRVHLETCDGEFIVQTLNFSAHDEQNLSRINPYKFDATFDQWLGSGDVKRNTTFTNSSLAEKLLCLFPVASTHFIDAQIKYDEIDNQTAAYTARNYFFQNDSINNVSEDIFLYLLQSSASTSFILNVQDDNLLPLENFLVVTERFYPGENIFRIVQIGKTSTNGKTIGFFETEIVDYRFIIKNLGITRLTTIQQKIVGEVAPFTITFTIGDDLGKPWADLDPLEELTFTLSFNKSSNITTYTWVDTSGNFELGTLIVEQQNFSFSTNSVLCNLNSSQSSATLACDVSGNGTGTYTARAFITRSGLESLVQQLNFIIESFLQIVGFLGVLLAWFIILMSSFAFKFNEIAGIFMINATVIFVNLVGLVSFGMLSISALIAVSIIIVAVIER